jgi:hypothetical protein
MLTMTRLAMKAAVVASAASVPRPKVRKEGRRAVPLAPLRSMKSEMRKARKVRPAAGGEVWVRRG